MLALTSHRDGTPADVCSRLRDAELHARRSSPEERQQVEAIVRHLRAERAISSP
jgi:hypothetical protein